MRKIIDIPQTSIPKLKLIAALQGKSVKKCMEDAVEFYIAEQQKNRITQLSTAQKEDLGLLLLMQQAQSENPIDASSIL